MGGTDDRGEPLTSVERYDEGEDKWEAVASMSSERVFFGVGVLCGRLYVMGGQDIDSEDQLASVERYDEGANKWEEVAEMRSWRMSLGVAAAHDPCSFASSSSSLPDALSLDLEDN